MLPSFRPWWQERLEGYSLPPFEWREKCQVRPPFPPSAPSSHLSPSSSSQRSFFCFCSVLLPFLLFLFSFPLFLFFLLLFASVLFFCFSISSFSTSWLTFFFYLFCLLTFSDQPCKTVITSYARLLWERRGLIPLCYCMVKPMDQAVAAGKASFTLHLWVLHSLEYSSGYAHSLHFNW